ncbi:MAG: hypothetical protein II375_05690 [Bacteroidales bacterium]|nr:hypothetical protein [Bacteroidales bacterium]
MAKLFLAVAALLAVALALLAINIIIRKDGTFRSEDVGANKAMRQRGIHCYRAQDKIEQRDRSSINDMQK